MKRKIFLIVGLLTLQFSFSSWAKAQGGKDLEIIRESNKVALVIGNSNYRNGFSLLRSPKNDAAAMGAALKRLGFRLVGGKVHLDASFQEMEDLLDRFTEEIKRGGVGFFYFSGHGSQDNNRNNFLIPVDTSIKYQSDLRHLALKVELVTSRMEEAENRLNILVLDACRNNPLPSGFKSGSKGLNSDANIPSGIYIAYAARDGQVAADGEFDGYSLYTRELLNNIETKNERLEDIFIKTRIAVKRETKNAQYPIDYGSIDGRFYFLRDSDVSAGNSNTTGINTDRIKEAEKYFDLGVDCPETDYDCKISNYSKAINLNPNDASAYYNRGISYDDKKDYDAAIRDYTKAIELNPKYTSAYYNRGISYTKKKEYDAAIRDYTRTIGLDPKFPSAYYNRGNLYDDKKDYDAAIRDYTRAIELNPNKSNYYHNRAISYDKIGETDKAQADRKKAEQLALEDLLENFEN